MRKPISQFTRDKMRLARLGRKFPGGWKLTEETRKKQSVASKGRPKSPEHIINISKAKKGKPINWNPKSRIIGSKHPNWKGGQATRKARRVVYERNRQLKKIGNLGSHNLEEWEILKAQYNWMCLFCKKQEPGIKLTKDHIIPISKGGSNNIENIQPLCRSCNSKKATKIINFINETKN